ASERFHFIVPLVSKEMTLPAPMRLELKPLRGSKFRISRLLGYKCDPNLVATIIFKNCLG
ncbi:MAG: hypothetical protein ACI8WB_005440, partial [Phenylobacterium sp.]